MRDTYVAATRPIWNAWSASYIHQWLIDRGILKDTATKRRQELVTLMERYYYDVNDKVWSAWGDSQMKTWLVEHGIIKSNAQLKREKMEKLVSCVPFPFPRCVASHERKTDLENSSRDNYSHAQDVTWGAWTDSDMRAWLIDHGYLRSDAQKKRDDLVKLMKTHYADTSARTAAYLTWPDARLRAYLREHGMSDASLPTGRPELLQEVRVRWVETNWHASSLWRRVKDIFDSGVEVAEDKLGMILDILTGGAEGAKEGARSAHDKYDEKQKVEL